MTRGWLRAHDHQPRLWTARENGRQHFECEPVERLLIGRVAKASEEQHRVRLTAVGLKLIARGRDAGAIVIEPAAQLRQERQQVVSIFRTAHLNEIEAWQNAQLVT